LTPFCPKGRKKVNPSSERGGRGWGKRRSKKGGAWGEKKKKGGSSNEGVALQCPNPPGKTLQQGGGENSRKAQKKKPDRKRNFTPGGVFCIGGREKKSRVYGSHRETNKKERDVNHKKLTEKETSPEAFFDLAFLKGGGGGVARGERCCVFCSADPFKPSRSYSFSIKNTTLARR